MTTNSPMAAQWKKVVDIFYLVSASFFLFSIPTTLGWAPISQLLQPMLEVHYFIASYMSVAYLIVFLLLVVAWVVMSFITKD